VAHRAVATATLRAGTERAAGGTVAEAAYPVIYQGRVVRVIVYSDPVSDIVRNVSTVRHEILVAGGIALLLALIGGYVVARALARRGKHLEGAAVSHGSHLAALGAASASRGASAAAEVATEATTLTG